MKEYYEKSLQMIKKLNIKNEKEYNRLVRNYLILNTESLKYITKTRRFKKVVKVAQKIII